jgi:hypothetical protein
MARIDALLRALEQRCAAVGQPRLYDTRLLTERAALSGLKRGGAASCNRTCRLLEARDGWIAINLAREVDRNSVPALVGCTFEEEPWSALARATPRLRVAQLVESARRLGLAVAAVGRPAVRSGEAPPDAIFPVQPIAGVAPRSPNWTRFPPLVIDLSALWAGPLCAHLLGQAGAHVIKVESPGRPDSIRATAPEFFARLNCGKESVALDLTRTTDRARLRTLIARADIVVSSGRPRAFEQMDLVPHELVAGNPGLTWVAITSHGWSGAASNAIGFGDDAAAGAGLLAWSGSGAPMFVGDAIADPLTGIAAAAAAIDHQRSGGGVLIDASLHTSAAYVAGARRLGTGERGRVSCASGSWWLHVQGTRARVNPPRARPHSGCATPFGADTQRVLSELDLG